MASSFCSSVSFTFGWGNNFNGGMSHNWINHLYSANHYFILFDLMARVILWLSLSWLIHYLSISIWGNNFNGGMSHNWINHLYSANHYFIVFDLMARVILWLSLSWLIYYLSISLINKLLLKTILLILKCFYLVKDKNL